MQPRPLTLNQIQRQVLDQETVLLEYSLGEERSYLWVVTSASITSHELAKRSEIESAVGNFYNLVNARNTDVKGETKEQRASESAVRTQQSPSCHIVKPDGACSRSGTLGQEEIGGCRGRRAPLCPVWRVAGVSEGYPLRNKKKLGRGQEL